MAAATQAGSVGSVRPPKAEKTRRSWTEREEEILLASLKELVAEGWKSDNGFRPGYLNKLEVAMRKEFPMTDLKAMPHITSRLTTWKKNYCSLVSILNRSGVGFNVNGDFKVDATEEQWEEIYPAEKDAAKIRSKGWPLFEGWKIVFGKDRATGEHAEGLMDAVNELMNEHGGANHVAATGEETDYEIDTQTDGTSTCQSQKGAASSNTRKKKRKCLDGGIQGMCDLLGKIHRDTNARLENLANRFGFATDVGVARKDVFTLINKVPDLNLKENFKVCDILVDKPERLEFFMALPELARPDYVYHLLHDQE